MSLSKPLGSQIRGASALETSPDGYTQPLCVGLTIYYRHPETRAAAAHIIAGFLLEKDGRDKPILMVTGGPMVPTGTKFYRSNSMRDGHEDDELGGVGFYYQGLILIGLFGRTRDEVSNLLFSESGQSCMPVVYEGDCRSLWRTRALNHVGQPVQVVIEDAGRRWQNGPLQPIFAFSGQPMGSLVTSVQGDDSDSRQLQAYGVIHATEVLSNGQTYALVSMLYPGLTKLEGEEDFKGKTLEFVAPIMQCEGSDGGELSPTDTAARDMPSGPEHQDSVISSEYGPESDLDSSGMSHSESEVSLSNLGAAATRAAATTRAAQVTERANRRSNTPVDDGRDSCYSTKSQNN